MFDMMIQDFNLDKKDKLPLLIVAIFSLIVTLKLIEFHMSGGIFFPDKALYLISSLYYAGMDYYHIMDVNDLFFSPIISFLASGLFRIGIVDQLSISIVTAIFGFFSFFGLYIFLRNRFNPLLSLTGVIIYGSLSEVLLNLASGLLDIPSISISIWVLVFAIIAIDKNPKYFLISFPLLCIGFFTRYTVGFILPLIFLYYAMQRDLIGNIHFSILNKQFRSKISEYLQSQEFRYLLVSLLFSIILFVIIVKFLILDYGGSLTFIEQSTNTFNGYNAGTNIINFEGDTLYFIKNFSLILFHNDRFLDTTQAFILYFILALGFISTIVMINKNKIFRDSKYYPTLSNFNKILLLIDVILFIMIFLGFKVYSNHMVANICLLSMLLILYYFIVKFNVDKNHQALNILNFAYFFVYLIFFSLYSVKVTRYALPLIPPFIYFVVLSLNNMILCVKENNGIIFKFNSSKFSKIIPILLICIFMISTISFIGPIEIEKKPVESIDYFINYKGSPNDLVNVTQHIIETNPDYHSKTFASYYHHYRMIKWYLKANVTFINDDYRLIDESGVDYVILNEKVPFKNYHKIYKCGDFYLYYKN